MGKTNIDHLSFDEKEYLADLQEDMDIARQEFIEAKEEFERACDAVFCFVRSKRESQ
jgi:hypothetical protein